MPVARKPSDQSTGRACEQPVVGPVEARARGFVAMVLGNDAPTRACGAAASSTIEQ